MFDASSSMTEAEFDEWDVCQPIRFDLIDSRPVRRPDEQQGPARVQLLAETANRVFRDLADAEIWMTFPNPDLGDLAPLEVAAGSEAGCQSALRNLVRSHRCSNAVGPSGDGSGPLKLATPTEELGVIARVLKFFPETKN